TKSTAPRWCRWCRRCWPRRRRRRKPASASNHEEAVRIVAAKLLDETELPVEIGLHRLLRDLGAFIRAAVAVRGIRLWQHERRPLVQRAVIAAVEDVDLPAHLREP